MSDAKTTSYTPTLLAFLAGAALGAVAVALTTPKSGPELRGNLKALGRQAKCKASELSAEATDSWDDLKDSTAQAATDLKRGMIDAANDLRG
jgi:gas vesicle protein